MARKNVQEAKRQLFNFIIEQHLAEGLQEIKKRDGISMTFQVNQAIAAWLEAKGLSVKAEPKVRSNKRSRK